MLRATVVSCSSSCLIPAIWTSFSRATTLSGNVAFSSTSESISMPSFRSGFVTSSATVKLLFPASLDIEPPTASIWFAICSAVRVLVPLTSVFAIKRVMPFVCEVSANNPPRNTAVIDTKGRRSSSRTRTRSPFDSSNFWISAAVIGFAPSALASSDPFGFNDTTLRFSVVRYLAATRLISSSVTFCTASR